MIDLDEISFAEWLVELNKVAKAERYVTKESFVSATGQIEWCASFEAGLSPEEALCSAALDGLEFGLDY